MIAGNTAITTGRNFYGRVFYDADNTSYYLDPASTSVLNLLNLTGNLTVGSDTNEQDFIVYGNDTGEKLMWDGSESKLIINHDTDDFGVGIFTVSSAQMTQPQLKVGRDAGQYWGVYTDDRNAHLVHRQDETSGNLTTRFEQWDSNTSDLNGEWLWQSGDGTGGSMTTALTLTQAGNATFTGNITSQAIKVDQTGSDAGLHIGRSDMTSSNFATTNNAIFFGDELPAGSYRHQASISAVREAWSNSPTSLVFKTSATVNSATTALTLNSSQNAIFAGDITVNGSDGIKVQSGNQGNAIRLVTNNDGTQIADDFSANTAKSYIYFDARSVSNDPGYIMHETSANSSSEANKGVLHLVPSDDNSTGDYVSIHGTNDPDVLRLHTSGLIETANLQLTLKSGSNEVYVNDDFKVSHISTFQGNATFVSSAYFADTLYHYGDTDTYIAFDTNRVRVAAGGTIFLDTNTRSVGDIFSGRGNAPSDLNNARMGICLLYTSPSPRDQRGSRMPSCG